MRALLITNTAQELTEVPFLPNYTVVFVNATAADEIVQTSDALAGDYTTLVTVPAGTCAEIELDNVFIKLASAGNVVMLGN
jgi:hypothetical protein